MSPPGARIAARRFRFLDQHGIAHEEIDVDESEEAEELVLRVNDGRRKVPTFELDGRYFSCSPYDRERLAEELKKSAEILMARTSAASRTKQSRTPDTVPATRVRRLGSSLRRPSDPDARNTMSASAPTAITPFLPARPRRRAGHKVAMRTASISDTLSSTMLRTARSSVMCCRRVYLRHFAPRLYLRGRQCEPSR